MKLKGVYSNSTKTKNLIKDTLKEYLVDCDSIKYLSVIKLVDNAGITRGAFYSHYNNILEVIYDIEKDMEDSLFSNIDNISNYQEFINMVDNLFIYIGDNKDIYNVIINIDNNNIFNNNLNKKINDYLERFIDNNIDRCFIVDGLTSMLYKYFKYDIEYSINDIRNNFIRFVDIICSSYIKGDNYE